ncbi:MAG: amino acid adenylation domain-containing protein [Ignavibacteriae bacterium]|nr:amino acid adenylation domain-containing protein [Ignavibacteriota bacterium]
MSNRYIYNLGILFDEVCKKHKDSIALHYNKKHFVTFSDLKDLSNSIANYLLSSGISRGDVVAIFNTKSEFAFSVMIACLKIGAIYTNLDLTSPWERISKILSKCKPKIVVKDYLDNKVLDKALIEDGYSVIDLHSVEFQNEFKRCFSEKLDINHEINGSNPAYIMFTSGSTGFPKGAVMSHQNLINFIGWGKERFDVKPDDAFTNVNPIYFDNSVFDFYTAIFTGTRLVVFPNDAAKDVRGMLDKINELKCTIWFSVPSFLVYLITTKILNKNEFKHIRKISFGGEGFPKPRLKYLYDLYKERAEFVNVYGPTECTCICSSYKITEKDFDNMSELAPLGFLAPNFDYEIIPIDENDKTYGELCLKGPNVGLGYYGDEELTRKSFIKNPYNSMLDEKIYKTGDIVKKADNGYLLFKGRIDNQIKHMGYRIELEEIESVINTLEYVNESAVLYKKEENGIGQILAFVNSKSRKDSAQIGKDLKSKLPPYMKPKKIIVMEELPKNRNGKTDKLQLKELLKEL